jgi:mannose-1-phosphate guanylyltransferase
VVIAGGSGTRVWPRSRNPAPKQLLAILGARSMLQETIARLSPPIPRRNVVVVTGRAHGRAVRAQLRGLPPRSVLVEPESRNTAAAIALAALHVARRAPEAVMAVLPADHAIGDLPAFRRDLRLALDVAERTGCS